MVRGNHQTQSVIISWFSSKFNREDS
ncbi:MAG TPA: hypothetical protein DEG17_09890 [Cyanobacteria bacterium UBA11149]|nr:hypothetical protein [Cyanobacteria bacterium UBA11367]HBE57171.1 hypothetical protein [Cyanobacteria bacterium UBA11366]HBK66179.1 hypothetical protein [Cyanobacteria bacterium UBA11166]HBR73671.1 hypothetical protein [Cyanobacteria bacterium UBA11159]HBS71458.1 hypothetical protein [Cyanobacteria bacterium UBA11153]HBW89158.1 hypothetical protein [Cyanobacteria bacterium UBA11149]HCA94711.1 hypothetical protein [Cyanobacteria bacterium UBA9226]